MGNALAIKSIVGLVGLVFKTQCALAADRRQQRKVVASSDAQPARDLIADGALGQPPPGTIARRPTG
jgi:hypothetical protein